MSDLATECRSVLTVFVVSHYTDRIQERGCAEYTAQVERCVKWGLTSDDSFDTLAAAQKFLIERAKQRVAQAEARLKQEKLRLRKLVKKFTGGGGAVTG